MLCDGKVDEKLQTLFRVLSQGPDGEVARSELLALLVSVSKQPVYNEYIEAVLSRLVEDVGQGREGVSFEAFWGWDGSGEVFEWVQEFHTRVRREHQTWWKTQFSPDAGAVPPSGVEASIEPQLDPNHTAESTPVQEKAFAPRREVPPVQERSPAGGGRGDGVRGGDRVMEKDSSTPGGVAKKKELPRREAGAAGGVMARQGASKEGGAYQEAKAARRREAERGGGAKPTRQTSRSMRQTHPTREGVEATQDAPSSFQDKAAAGSSVSAGRATGRSVDAKPGRESSEIRTKEENPTASREPVGGRHGSSPPIVARQAARLKASQGRDQPEAATQGRPTRNPLDDSTLPEEAYARAAGTGSTNPFEANYEPPEHATPSPEPAPPGEPLSHPPASSSPAHTLVKEFLRLEHSCLGESSVDSEIRPKTEQRGSPLGALQRGVSVIPASPTAGSIARHAGQILAGTPGEDSSLEDRELLPLGAPLADLQDMFRQLPSLGSPAHGGAVSRPDLIFVLEDPEVRTLLVSASRYQGSDLGYEVYREALGRIRANAASQPTSSLEELAQYFGPVIFPVTGGSIDLGGHALATAAQKGLGSPSLPLVPAEYLEDPMPREQNRGDISISPFPASSEYEERMPSQSIALHSHSGRESKSRAPPSRDGEAASQGVSVGLTDRLSDHTCEGGRWFSAGPTEHPDWERVKEVGHRPERPPPLYHQQGSPISEERSPSETRMRTCKACQVSTLPPPRPSALCPLGEGQRTLTSTCHHAAENPRSFSFT